MDLSTFTLRKRRCTLGSLANEMGQLRVLTAELLAGGEHGGRGFRWHRRTSFSSARRARMGGDTGLTRCRNTLSCIPLTC